MGNARWGLPFPSQKTCPEYFLRLMARGTGPRSAGTGACPSASKHQQPGFTWICGPGMPLGQFVVYLLAPVRQDMVSLRINHHNTNFGDIENRVGLVRPQAVFTSRCGQAISCGAMKPSALASCFGGQDRTSRNSEFAMGCRSMGASRTATKTVVAVRGS